MKFVPNHHIFAHSGEGQPDNKISALYPALIYFGRRFAEPLAWAAGQILGALCFAQYKIRGHGAKAL